MLALAEPQPAVQRLPIDSRFGHDFARLPVQRQAAEEEEELQARADPSALVQRQPEEEEELQGKLDPSVPVQRQADEEEELQGKLDPSVPVQRQAEEEEELQARADPSAPVQRQSGEEEELQAKAEGGISTRRADVEAHGPGAPLPPALLTRMGAAFGADLSDVRIHQGPQARSIGALAYTRGRDVHFQPGRYDPASRQGQELVGHEMAHVVQQRAGRVAAPQGKGVPVNADPALEAEADRAGERAAAGETAHVSGSGGGVQAKADAIQRVDDTDTLLQRPAQRLLAAHRTTGGFRRAPTIGAARTAAPALPPALPLAVAPPVPAPPAPAAADEGTTADDVKDAIDTGKSGAIDLPGAGVGFADAIRQKDMSETAKSALASSPDSLLKSVGSFQVMGGGIGLGLDAFDMAKAIKEKDAEKGVGAGINLVGDVANIVQGGSVLAGAANVASVAGYVGSGAGIATGLWEGGKGIYKGVKAHRAQKQLAEMKNVPPELAAAHQLAVETQQKRKKRAVLNTTSGALQVAGGVASVVGAAAGGVGSAVGAALAAAGTGLKFGAKAFRWLKQKARDSAEKGGRFGKLFHADASKSTAKKKQRREGAAQSLLDNPAVGADLLANLGGDDKDVALLRGGNVPAAERAKLLKRISDLYAKRE